MRAGVVRAVPSLLAMIVVGLCVSPSLTRATPFVFQPVDTAGNVGCYSNIVIDDQDNPHLISFTPDTKDLHYVTRKAGRWMVEVVDSAGKVGGCNAIAVDAYGNPHIAYTDETVSGGGTGNLKYAVRIGGVWQVSTIVSDQTVHHEAAIAIDAQGQPHVAYKATGTNIVRYGNKLSGTWTFETVESGGGYLGGYISLALDDQGQPHLTYPGASADVHYASKIAGNWVIETAYGTASSGPVMNALAIDAQGHPHIAHRADSGVLYTTKVGGSWATTTIDATAGSGYFAVVRIDGAGDPHVSYMDYPNGSGNLHLKYAKRKNGVWTTEVVVATGFTGVESDMDLDSQDNPHFSYYESVSLDHIYATSAVYLVSPAGGEYWPAGTRQNVVWQGGGAVDVLLSADGGRTYSTLARGVSDNRIPITVPALTSDQARIMVRRAVPFSSSESQSVFSIGPGVQPPWWYATVDTAGTVGQYPSLELDGHDNPRIAYYDLTNADLKYAQRAGGTWVTELVDGASSQVGPYCSLALDREGNPRVSYYSVSAMDLKYASKSSGTWTIEAVDTAGAVGTNTSLALDASGNPRISYYDSQNARLKYASKSGGIWTLEVVDATTYAGTLNSLSLDGLGIPYIAYYLLGDLKYATKSGGSWTTETVDAVGDVGMFPSIAVDKLGRPTISYLDYTSGDLKLARKIDGIWRLEFVDFATSSPGVGAYSTLDLDEMGDPHIGYWDGPNYDLKYATRKGEGPWTIVTVDSIGSVGGSNGLEVDSWGRPHIAYQDFTNGNLKYASAAIEVREPSPGTTWPVGGRRTITWDGAGLVDVSLSVDGGASYDLIASGVGGGQYRLTVPYTPSKFCKLRLSRAVPRSDAVTDSFFTINTSISLLSFSVVAPPNEDGVMISWRTDPGPEDLSGYRLERSAGDGLWSTLVPLTQETSYRDREGSTGSRYRIFAVTAHEMLLLGMTDPYAIRPLTVWPSPYRGGPLTVSFAAAGGLGGGKGAMEVDVYDLSGRLRRVLIRGDFSAGVHRTTWNGRDERGDPLAAGLYFLRARSQAHTAHLKLVVMP
jgi:hypothetical protein